MDDRETIEYLAGLPEGQFVLHGSPHQLSVIEPREPKFLYIKKFPELSKCAVYGTLVPRIALLYANIHEDRAHWGWKANFYTSPKITVVAPDPLKGGKGYLYLLPRTSFERFFEHGVTCAAYRSVTPHERIEVAPTMLETLQREFEVDIHPPP